MKTTEKIKPLHKRVVFWQSIFSFVFTILFWPVAFFSFEYLPDLHEFIEDVFMFSGVFLQPISFVWSALYCVSKQDFKTISSQKTVSKDGYPGFPDFDGATWIKPLLVCKVKYMERPSGGGLRQPVFKGLREDKVPEDCVM